MENCPGRYRGLRAAVPAIPQTALRLPSLVCSTFWAYKATRPTQRGQILQTSCFTIEPFFELFQGARIILHPWILHIVATGVNPIPQFKFYSSLCILMQYNKSSGIQSSIFGKHHQIYCRFEQSGQICVGRQGHHGMLIPGRSLINESEDDSCRSRLSPFGVAEITEIIHKKGGFKNFATCDLS